MLSSKKYERKTGLGPATPTLARLCSTNWAISAYQIITVKRRRLELPRHNCHYPLKVARLPIPPPLQKLLFTKYLNKDKAWCCLQKNMSGKRDSDPRPQPWQGCALPTELFPQFFLLLRSVPLNASAKVLLFSELPNFSWTFFEKKMHFAHFSGKNAPFSVVIVPFYWFSSFFYPVFNPYAKDNPHIQIRVRFPNFHPNERYL